MISIFPQRSQTLVLPLSRYEVVVRLVSIANSEPDAPQLYKPLMGWVKDDQFQLALRARRPNGFSPVAIGRIESTSSGCLIFLDYRLMPATQFYLAFWSIIAILTGIVTIFYYKNLPLGAASLAGLVFINGVAWANFHLHRKVLHKTLLNAME